MTTSLRKLLIANRGEIAVRIIRAAQALGIKTVAACSEADADSLAARMADEVQLIGPARADRSYLNADALLKAARDSGADAIHPGYGFLSENAAFAEAVSAAGLIFVGPEADTIRRMGDKAEARRTAAAAGVPVVPGSAGELEDIASALACADEVGYPLLIKASAGGGGRGIRMARDAVELAREFPLAQGEAQAAFGSGAVYLERFIRRARHIEVQILGDGQRAVHLFERECSLQRRRQKVFEEAPSPALTPQQRQALCDSAVRLAARLRYRGAGTLEYLFDDESGEFFFIEMNTRIQVEHPVTEMITDIDLVLEQIRIAAGGDLPCTQDELQIIGHAIECRINAENPETFRPSPGTITQYHPPGGLGVRIDSAVYQGYKIPPYYDSLVGKLIVHGKNRPECLMRLRRALDEIVVDGVETTLPLFRKLAREKDMIEGDYHIHWLEQYLAGTSK